MAIRGDSLRWRWGVGVAVSVALVLVVALMAAVPTPASGRAFSASSSPATGPAATVSSVPTVLIIGDSTTVHMRAAFESALAAQGLAAIIDAKSGRTTFEGRAVLAKYDPADYDLVVVLLGANGRRENAVRDMKALKARGVDVVATVQAPRQGKVNKAVRRVFGAERITWAGYAKKHHISTTDGKHYTAADYRSRARYLAAQIARRAAA